MTEVISEISDEQLSRLKEAWLSSFDNSSRFGTREEIEDIISRFYSYNGMEKPVVFWCQSPLQVMYFHLLLDLFSLSENFLGSVRYLADAAPTKKWCFFWKQLLSEVERINQLYPDFLSESRPGSSSHSNVLYDRLVQGSYISKFCQLDLFAETNLSKELFNQLRHEYERTVGAVLPSTNNGMSLQNNSPSNRVLRFVELMTGDANFLSDLLKQLPQKVKEELKPHALEKVGPVHFADIEELRARDIFRIPQLKSLDELIEQAFLLDVNIDLGLWWGIWTAGFISFHAKLIEILELDRKSDTSLIRAARLYSELSEKTFCIGFSKDVCYVCEPPSVLSFNEQTLHSTTGPAIKLKDGSELYALYGVPVYRELIEGLNDINAPFIYGTGNVEVRRALMKFYGEDRFLKEIVARVLDTDDTGTLYMVEFDNDEPLVMVKVRNGTPEPDGTFKDYFLRVPPFMRSAKEAVAWTFGLEKEQYEPVVET